MNAGDVPLLTVIRDAGPDDQILDSLLLLGPCVIGIVLLLGRTLLTELLAIIYLAVFAGYVLSQVLQ